jgi:hypothetical protein
MNVSILFKGKPTKSRETVSSSDDAASEFGHGSKSTVKDPRVVLTDYFKSSGNAEMSTETRADVDGGSVPADDNDSSVLLDIYIYIYIYI